MCVSRRCYTIYFDWYCIFSAYPQLLHAPEPLQTKFLNAPLHKVMFTKAEVIELIKAQKYEDEQNFEQERLHIVEGFLFFSIFLTNLFWYSCTATASRGEQRTTKKEGLGRRAPIIHLLTLVHSSRTLTMPSQRNSYSDLTVPL